MSSGYPTHEKDPDAVLDWVWNWKDVNDPWLGANEVISSHEIIVPAGITKDSSTNDDTTVTVWLSGGTVGDAYTVTSRITTNEGRTEDDSIRILIKEK